MTRFDTNTSRTVYAVKIGSEVYVLHAFQKKSSKVIKTSEKDKDLIKRRYKQAIEMEKRKWQEKKIEKETAYETGSDNVFADLGLDDVDELLTRAKLGHTVRMILEKKGLKQREISALLKIDKGEVSKLMNGKYHLFSEGRLFGFLNKLDRKVTVQISNLKKHDKPQEVVFA